jgi:hypothetical protein
LRPTSVPLRSKARDMIMDRNGKGKTGGRRGCHYVNSLNLKLLHLAASGGSGSLVNFKDGSGGKPDAKGRQAEERRRRRHNKLSFFYPGSFGTGTDSGDTTSDNMAVGMFVERQVFTR